MVTLIPDNWSHVAQFLDIKDRASLSKVSKITNESVASQTLFEFTQFAQANELGSERMQYLLQATNNIPLTRRVSLIFEEVQRCAQLDHCKHISNVTDALNEMALRQTNLFYAILRNLNDPQLNQELRQVFPSGRPDATNLVALKTIRSWLQNNPMTNVKKLSLNLSQGFPSTLPPELNLFPNLRRVFVNGGCLLGMPNELKQSKLMVVPSSDTNFSSAEYEKSIQASNDYQKYLDFNEATSVSRIITRLTLLNNQPPPDALLCILLPFAGLIACLVQLFVVPYAELFLKPNLDNLYTSRF